MLPTLRRSLQTAPTVRILVSLTNGLKSDLAVYVALLGHMFTFSLKTYRALGLFFMTAALVVYARHLRFWTTLTFVVALVTGCIIQRCVVLRYQRNCSSNASCYVHEVCWI
jgi:hypothetical protein